MGQSETADTRQYSAVAWTVIVAGPRGRARGRARAGRSVSPPERTFVVVTARRPSGLDALPPGRAHVLVEPLDRGTAAAILLPVHWIHAIDPEATVVVFGDDLPGKARDRGSDRPGAHPSTRRRSFCSGLHPAGANPGAS